MYDMVSWFRNPNWKTSHLEGTNTNPITSATSKVYQACFDTGKTLGYIKTKGGFPVELKEYDNAYIYDTTTELDWTSPNDYKANGWPICPRFWDGDPTWYYYQAVAQWTSFSNCKQLAQGQVGPVQYSLQGPFVYDFGGQVGPQQTILLTYLWTAPKNREQLFLTQTFGWVRWKHATLQPNGLYLVDSDSNHNLIVPGTVASKFTCFPIP